MPVKRRLHFTATDLAFMEAWYRDGYSTGEIAVGFECWGGSVWARLRARRVPLRPLQYRRPRRTRHSAGYVLIGGKYEHRLVAEKMLGRPLLPSEVVHHKNHRKDDNRPENLEVLSSSSRHQTERHDYQVWTPAQEQVMLDGLASGLSAARIGQLLGKKAGQVYLRIRRLQKRGVLGLHRPGRKRGGKGEVLAWVCERIEADYLKQGAK